MAGVKYKSIVVGLDFSAYSKKVLEQALELGRLYDIPVTAVHATLDASEFLEVSLIGQSEIPTLRKIREQFIKYYKLNIKKVNVLSLYGSPDKVILDVAKKQKQPLIIVGYKGHSAISKFLLGSTAERLALTSPYSVWIHRGNKAVRPRKILVPHDLKKASDKALQVAQSLGNGKKPKIETCYIYSEPVPILYYEGWVANHNLVVSGANRAISKFKKSHPKLNLKSAKGDVVENIIKRSGKFDVVVMCPHNHTETFHSFGKVTGKVVRGSQVPVLVVGK